MYYQVMLMLRQDRISSHDIEHTKTDLLDGDLRLDKFVSNERVGYCTRDSSSIQFYARDSFSIQFYAVCVKKHQVHPWKSADSAATSQTETREEEEEAEILELFDGR
jgi:5-keto 4-deoxyuronate isomerase